MDALLELPYACTGLWKYPVIACTVCQPDVLCNQQRLTLQRLCLLLGLRRHSQQVVHGMHCWVKW
jgi:hypothetical protein